MMRFVEEKSPIMHIDVIVTEIAKSLHAAYPDACVMEADIKEHIARHVVTPVASITRITRDLLDICETLRPSQEQLVCRRKRRKTRGRPRAASPAPSHDSLPDEDDEPRRRSRARQAPPPVEDEAEEPAFAEEEISMYLKTVGQVMSIYRLHSRLLQPPTVGTSTSA